MIYLSTLMIPFFILMIVSYGLVQRVGVFDCFVSGAKEGIETTFRILPSLVGLITAVTVFRHSGALELITGALQPLLEKIRFPAEVLPLALMRPVSGSGALAIVQDLYATHGPDSFIGRAASVMMGSTETTFYTVAVYFGSIGVRRTRYTVKAALVADLFGMLLSVYLVQWLLQGG